MKYNIFLKCQSCGKESIKKEYDESEVDKAMENGTKCLKFPMYLMCPNCHNLLSVKMMKEAVK